MKDFPTLLLSAPSKQDYSITSPSRQYLSWRLGDTDPAWTMTVSATPFNASGQII